MVGISRQNFKREEQFNLMVQTAASGARSTGFKSWLSLASVP